MSEPVAEDLADLMELLDELPSVEFEQTSKFISELDERPTLTLNMSRFITSYAKYCAALYLRGVVPSTTDELGFARQFVRSCARRVDRKGAQAGKPTEACDKLHVGGAFPTQEEPKR